MTDLQDRLIDGLVSPTGEWLAFRRNMEIWVAPLGAQPVREADVRQLTHRGAATFSFTPDGSAIIYSSGNRVWRQALTGGEPEEIPIRLQLTPIIAPPRLVRRVRVLDFDAGGFGPEVALLIEQGRIRWIGDELGQELPGDADILDAGGRFVIPGLFDMHVHSGRYFGMEADYLAFGVGLPGVRRYGGPQHGRRACVDERDDGSREDERRSRPPHLPRWPCVSTVREFSEIPGHPR